MINEVDVPKTATRFVKKKCQKVLPDWAKSRQNDKKLPKWQKFDKVAKNHQIGKKSPKWLKVLKLGSKGFQGVSDGSWSQTAWAWTT